MPCRRLPVFFVVLLLGACAGPQLLVGYSRPGSVARIAQRDGDVQWRDTYGTLVDGMWGFRRGPKRRIYVCSYRTGEIVRFHETWQRPEGVFIKHEKLVGPTDLIFRANGEVLVACSGSKHYLLDEDLPGEAATLLRFSGPGADEPGRLLGALAWPESAGIPTCLTEGPDGAVYVGSRDKGPIFRIDDENNVSEFADVGALLPAGAMQITFGPDGLLYATSPSAPLVVVVRDGVPFKKVEDPGLGKPAGLAFGKRGELFVASYDRGEIRRYDGVTGQFEGVLASELAAPWTVRVR